MSLIMIKSIFPLLMLVSLCSAGQNRPNIIYIMADDMGYADLGCYGRKDYQTPNLDKLASEGIKFTQAYSGAALCTPTRASFMTGRYPARTPVGLVEPLTGSNKDSLRGLTQEYSSFPTLLQKNGYKTFLVGKWHLGFLPAFSPRKNGFDEFYGCHGDAIDYNAHTNPMGHPDFYENETPVSPGGYTTDLLRDRTVEILKRKHTKPFYISLMFTAPHWPWQKPGDSTYPLTMKNWVSGGSAETFALMMKSMDDAVGKIMQTLDEQNLASNTVVIFTSDNGGEKYSDMGPFSGDKASLFEGGIRVPAFVRWPGKIPANSSTPQAVITMDWTATILALANAPADPRFPLDGINLIPILIHKKKPVDRTFYWRLFQRSKENAMLEGNWKYLRNEKGEYLFDILKDPGEKNDLKDKQIKVFTRLKNKFQDWEKTVLQPIPLD